MKIALQGTLGSFHHRAAVQYFGTDIDVIEKPNFLTVFESLASGEADFGCIAIENAIYGSLHENYDLLKRFGFPIVGEIFLKIDQNLIALPGTKLSDIKKVMSHPVALKQCEKFLSTLNVARIEYEDTAKAVKEIRDRHLTDTAGIASALAAELYGMEIIEKQIQDEKENYTRFLILAPKETNVPYNKISIRCTAQNKPGSLLRILQAIADAGGNMTKIESRPLLGKVWEYQFYIDLVIDPAHGDALLTALKTVTDELTVLGKYQEGVFTV